MITIQSILIEYKSVDTLNDSQHFVLKAILPGDKEILLSHPNLFLYYETNRAINR